MKITVVSDPKRPMPVPPPVEERKFFLRECTGWVELIEIRKGREVAVCSIQPRSDTREDLYLYVGLDAHNSITGVTVYDLGMLVSKQAL